MAGCCLQANCFVGRLAALFQQRLSKHSVLPEVHPARLCGRWSFFVCSSACGALLLVLLLLSVQVEGLQRAEHSPSVLLLDEVHERLSAMQHSVPHEQARAVEEGLQSLGRQPDNLPNQPGDQEQPDRIKYT